MDDREYVYSKHPEEQTPADFIDQAREQKLVARALPLLARHAEQFDLDTFDAAFLVLNEASINDHDDAEYIDSVGMDRIWAMTDAIRAAHREAQL